MNTDRPSLGRGLDSLLGERDSKSLERTLEVPVESFVPGQYQPRKKMHKKTLEELAESIKQQGILQPILARKQSSGTFEIVVGERRWRAAKIAGLSTIPTIVRDLNNDEAAKIALVENLQREDLNAIDQAKGLQRLQQEFNLSQKELAKSVGKSRPTITNLLRLTKLSPFVQELLQSGKIDMGHARALLSVEGDRQTELAKIIAGEGLSVRKAESLIAGTKTPFSKKSPKEKKDRNVIRLEGEISDALGAKADIKYNKKGSGKLIISFKSLEALEGILNKIKVK